MKSVLLKYHICTACTAFRLRKSGKKQKVTDHSDETESGDFSRRKLAFTLNVRF